MPPETVIAKPYHFASGEGLADVWWKSGRITVKTAGAETGNTFSQIYLSYLGKIPSWFYQDNPFLRANVNGTMTLSRPFGSRMPRSTPSRALSGSPRT